MSNVRGPDAIADRYAAGRVSPPARAASIVGLPPADQLAAILVRVVEANEKLTAEIQSLRDDVAALGVEVVALRPPPAEDPEPWKNLGMSRATYYRRLKDGTL